MSHDDNVRGEYFFLSEKSKIKVVASLCSCKLDFVLFRSFSAKCICYGILPDNEFSLCANVLVWCWELPAMPTAPAPTFFSDKISYSVATGLAGYWPFYNLETNHEILVQVMGFT